MVTPDRGNENELIINVCTMEDSGQTDCHVYDRPELIDSVKIYFNFFLRHMKMGAPTTNGRTTAAM